jgi:hypothetical protein
VDTSIAAKFVFDICGAHTTMKATIRRHRYRDERAAGRCLCARERCLSWNDHIYDMPLTPSKTALDENESDEMVAHSELRDGTVVGSD